MDHLLLASGLSASLLVLLLLGLGVVPSAPDPSPPAPDDSTGAQIHTERIGDRLRVQGVFVSEDASADTLRYELSLRRSGTAGTTQTTQSGPFATGPGQADTLSTTQVNVQSGDTLTLHLLVRRAETLIDSVRVRRTIP
ncbi:curli-like amyloid fiber formation chaperone CsgH [Salinibacter ruber]|uniref:curli-like amyloid fiber formation chaperone CsgH n=1 Tax=Salinibacter ruber TaxID=146919 RepID=UPI002073003E|nr:curli-like amyloid fiber formation chaperone CsgH [Salinibacter ruber]